MDEPVFEIPCHGSPGPSPVAHGRLVRAMLPSCPGLPGGDCSGILESISVMATPSGLTMDFTVRCRECGHELLCSLRPALRDRSVGVAVLHVARPGVPILWIHPEYRGPMAEVLSEQSLN